MRIFLLLALAAQTAVFQAAPQVAAKVSARYTSAGLVFSWDHPTMPECAIGKAQHSGYKSCLLVFRIMDGTKVIGKPAPDARTYTYPLPSGYSGQHVFMVATIGYDEFGNPVILADDSTKITCPSVGKACK
jgi:hypothetical protein